MLEGMGPLCKFVPRPVRRSFWKEMARSDDDLVTKVTQGKRMTRHGKRRTES